MTISLTWLKSSELFSEAMRKTTSNIELNDNELEFLLSCAIIFFNEYSGDKRKSPYFDIAYYITLKCAINNDYYQPLLDATSNFGIYPVAQYITKNNLQKKSETLDFILEHQLDRFKNKSITETYEQKKYREQIIASDSKENCYIAPTSFGKSTLIIDIINSKNPDKVAIIVPTKSLLLQTYKLIKLNFPLRKIIFHDDMHEGSENYISILTQERALRLLKKKTSFDLLVIDEAHNLFEMDSRSILLTRLIRRNRLRNPQSKNYYLSPLIADTENLKTSVDQSFFERRIAKNIKEPDIYEFRTNGDTYAYNRFLDEFYSLGRSPNFTSYIIENKKEKNFLYLRSPKKVEELSIRLNNELPHKKSTALEELSQTISNNVHKDFYCVDHIKKGLIYLHGKLPDLIKEYLEHKFTHTEQLQYIVANSVILEGVNLPVDSLFILNTHKLDEKSLTNLIGRVNRLNNVFDDNRRSLDKLLPPVHFVNSDEFNRKGGKMENQIKLLKTGLFKDIIDNPLLVTFNADSITKKLDSANEKLEFDKIAHLERKLLQLTEIQARENFLINHENDESSRVKHTLMESGAASVYYDPDEVSELLEQRMLSIVKTDEWQHADIIDKVYLYFIKSIESKISDTGFLRLQHPKAREFYRMFTKNLHWLNLKDHISETISYFHRIKSTDSRKSFYIGHSYGEISKLKDDGTNSGNIYIDLSKKTEKELVNLALVKIKIESDFVSYKLNEYVNALRDLEIISENEYNLHIYGTAKNTNTDFVKLGISGSLINRLERDNQIENISITESGELIHNEKFSEYVHTQDDLMQFEIGKYMTIK